MVTAPSDEPLASHYGNAVPTADELRRVALARAQARGKWVAKRRLLGRQIWHVLWTLIFPLLGLLTSVVLVIALILYLFGFHPISISFPWQEVPITRVDPTQQPVKLPGLTLQLDRQLSERPPLTPEAIDPQTK